MKKSLVFAGLLAFLSSGASVAQADTEQRHSIVFVLDCSKTMGQPINARDSAAEENGAVATTRFDCAIDGMRSYFDRASADGLDMASVWLFGHRLAWEGDSETPALMEQTAYLEQTMGFNVLSKLLPGDDVELVAPLRSVEPQNLTKFYHLMNYVKPWGQDPLYLSINRAIDSFTSPEGNFDKHLIVITDGNNSQGMSNHAMTKQRVLETIGRRPMPVHIIRIAGQPMDPQTETDLRQMVRASNGTYTIATSAAEVAGQIEAALSPKRAPTLANPLVSISRTEGGSSSAAARSERAIEGKLLFKNNALGKGKKVILKGKEAGSNYYVVSETDAEGRFKFSGVPSGEYSLHAECSVYNYIRTATRPLDVPAGSSDTLSADLRLE